MDSEFQAQLRLKATRLYQQGYDRLVRIPLKARITLGFFLFAAILMAVYTAISARDSTLHLRVQHSFRSANLSLWVDGDLAYSGRLTGSMKKKFGLIPAPVQGNSSQMVQVPSGQHQLRVRVVGDDGSTQEDNISGDFTRNTERELSVSARPTGLSLSWLAVNPSDRQPGSGWFERYTGSLLLTIAGSIISALTGFALREVPAHLRSRQVSGPKVKSTAAGQ